VIADGEARSSGGCIDLSGLTGLLYIHPKIGIVDDARLAVGSANLKSTRSSTAPR
jgi:phosphatidylserine/phosphatidylglycerophosphate/cardiolipin synthase-like enzyme